MNNNDNYEDIINISWPQPSKREPMPLNQRAKIFLPFAALTGFEELIEETKKLNEREDKGDTYNFYNIN